MESLQTKIQEIQKWRNVEKSVSSSLPIVKSHDIRLHTISTFHFYDHGRAIQHLRPSDLGPYPLGLIVRLSTLPRGINSDHLQVWLNHHQNSHAVP